VVVNDRVYIAKKRCRNRRQLLNQAEYLYFQYIEGLLKKIWWRWNKYIYLGSRERHRASRKISRSLKLCLFKRVLKKCIIKKINSPQFLQKISEFSKKIFFRIFLFRGISVHHALILFRFFRHFELFQYKNALWKWRLFTYEQHLLLGALHSTVTRRIDLNFWTGAGNAVKITPSLLFSDDSSLSSNTEDMCKWENLVPVVRLVHMNETDAITYRAFKALVAVYRRKYRFLRRSLHDFSANFFDNFVMKIVHKKFNVGNVLTSFGRLILAKKKFRAKFDRYRRTRELVTLLTARFVSQKFGEMCILANRRQRARLAMQCFFRIRLARLIYRAKVHVFTRNLYLERSIKVCTSERLLRKVLSKMRAMFCFYEGVQNSVSPLITLPLPTLSMSVVSESLKNGRVNKIYREYILFFQYYIIYAMYNM